VKYIRLSIGSVIEALAKLALALMYGVFLYIFLKDFWEHGRLSGLLFAVVESLFVYMSLTRRPAIALSKVAPAWLFAYFGTFAPLLVRPSVSISPTVGNLVQIVGFLFIGFSIVSLGRSFGLVAANRGVVTSGMYRYVRHPLYMSYFINIVGFFLNNASWYNALIILVWAVAQVVRIRHEEVLLGEDSLYLQYRANVRWRLIPYVY